MRRLAAFSLAFAVVTLLLPASASATDTPLSPRARTLERRLLSATTRSSLQRPPLTPRLVPDPTCSTLTSDGERLYLRVDSPVSGATITGYEPNCPDTVAVTGAATKGRSLYDFYFVIDSSGSTGRCTDSDIDGDGIVGVPDPFGFGCTDPGDSVLSAEVTAVREFVDTISPATARVAIIQFSDPEGTFGFGERQRIVQPLTNNFFLVRQALDVILLNGAAGATDYAGALSLLETEYFADGDPTMRRQQAYFLSDGVPTFPTGSFGAEDPGDSQASLDAADRLATEGIHVDTFGVGFLPSLTQDPFTPPRCVVVRPSGVSEIVSTLECMAVRTGGVFFASTDPADIVDQLRQRQPTGIQSVVVFNDTTGGSVAATVNPDGTFSATVPITEGVINLLRVVVTADDGTTCEVPTDFLSMCFAAGCSPLTQGYWHRQCLGLGLIPSNGNMPPHPDWDPPVLLRIMAQVVDPQVAALGSPADLTACEGLDAQPPDDMCQKAIKQYTAVLMNMACGKLGPACVIDIPNAGLLSPEDARALIASAIHAGLSGDPSACTHANDWADSINTGAAVR